MAFPASIWLVGAGNMGGAMLRRWIDAGADPASITVIDPFASEVPQGVTLAREEPAEVPDVIVLAVKPQQIDTILPSFRRTPESRVPSETPVTLDPGVRRDDGGKETLLLSILAGVEEATLAERFAVSSVVRAMPNLPVSLGQGVVALHTDSADPAVRETADTLMAPLGLVEWIDSEELFHAVTALSGSGPGFVYRFIESMADAGTALGLPADQALRFAIATVEGSAALAGQAGEPPTVLADRVASPKGTTREGLDVLDKDEAMKRLIHDTLAAAARRSAELAEAARTS